MLIILSCLLSANENSKDLQWIDKEIEAIKPPRKGVSYRSISLLKDPFIFLEKNALKKKKKKVDKGKESAKQVIPEVIPSMTNTKAIKVQKRYSNSLKLMAIINNSALINDHWYRVGDKVGGYKIVKITLSEVVLRNSIRSLTLTTKTKKLKK
ncbi:hypothetical protein MNB_SM-7-1510 [hydrothermal vent metagenome]|uniref:Uncharacterized protein n=1 Tax=hydrothermal vent metagenome TaxID=652676 RepID=A0A1W1B993_9ZZZZ